MSRDHHWRECRPALVSTSEATITQAEVDRMIAAWEATSDSDREAFHRFCCLNSRAPDDLIAVEKITKALRI